MSDPLKNKFKGFTLKFYDKQLRHDPEHTQKQLNLFLHDELIDIVDYYPDYDEHTGIHYNGVVKSSSYKNLYKKYSNKETKIPDFFLHMTDLPSTKDYNNWLFYCYMRKEVNFKRFNPAPPPEPKIEF